MENLEQQLQQLRLIHNRISSNDANSSVGGAGGQLPPTTITPTYKPTSYGYGKKHGVSNASSSGGGGGVGSDDIISCTSISGGAGRIAAVRWEGMGLNKRHDTLDNPIVLDQQLEALAHHKRQMEKRGLLQNQQIQYNNNKGVSQQQQQQQQQEIEPNKNIFKGIQALQKSPLFALDDENLQIQVNVNINNDDDNETSPPSPVSSSYSELRHAAESSSSSKLKQPQLQQQQQHMLSGNGTYMNLAYVPNSGSPATAVGASSIINNQQDCTDYYDFGTFSQSSSTYESIYEPINPRSSSQISNISSLGNNNRHHNNTITSNNNMAPYANLMSNSSSTITLNNITLSTTSLQQQNNSIATTLLSSSSCSNYDDDDDDDDGNRECGYDTEDTLTDYLDRSSLDYNECENYGICCKCNERVIGENSGCTAMEKIYHIECFTCTQCQINLQGKPFYAIDNKAYCEYDYLQTLEKCSVCTKPILERILRATGKPYHPQCFTCVVCGKSLDGIQFTVDATNQNYCITDFHKKFAPRCCVCKKPIMPESGEEETVRVVALDRSFHLKCYKCEDCGLLLSSNSEGRGCYPLDDHVLCKSCNAKRVQILTSSDL